MVPSSFHDFFTASASAGAALIGLLFVAVSIDREHTVTSHAPLSRQVMAASTFTALINAFFISLVALLPVLALPFIVLVMSALAMGSTLVLGRHLLQQQPQAGHTSKPESRLQGGLLLVVALGLYGFQFYEGLQLALHPSGAADTVAVLASLIVAVYGLGLTRAWQLLGAQRYSVFSEFRAPQDSSVTADPAPSRPSEP